MENKFLNYIQNNDDNLNNSDLNEHEKNNSEKLLSLLKNSIDTDIKSCNHDIEELCLYVEGKSLNNALIKEQILECDSCFETYSFLKSSLEEIKNITPPYFKEKIYENVTDTKNAQEIKEQNLVKKSFWYILKNNKLLKYSSGAIAACLLLFFTLNPFNTDMSDFHEPKYKEASNKSSNDSNIEESKSDQINSPSVSLEKPSLSIIANKKNFNKNNDKLEETNSNIMQKSKEFNKNSAPESKIILNKKTDKVDLQKEEKTERDNFFNQKTPKTIEFSKPEIIKKDIKLQDNKSQEDNKTNNSDRIKEKESLITQLPVTPSFKKEASIKPLKNISLAKKDTNNSPSARVLTKNTTNENKNQENNKKEALESKISILPAEPITPKETTTNQDADKIDDKKNEESGVSGNIVSPAKPSLSEVKDESEKKMSRVAPKVEEPTKKTLLINFTTNNNGFIIFKDNSENIIYKSNLIKKGKYTNFSIELNNNSQYFKYFYIDSNSNNIFDDSDIIDKTVKLIEN